jgi:signal transduction histidine kinase
MTQIVGRTRYILLAGSGLALGVLFLAVLGYRATERWRESAAMAAERRADEVAALLLTALTKDMRSAQQSILTPFLDEELASSTPSDFADTFARALARFPYVESFFVWNSRGDVADALLFSRAERRPSWMPPQGTDQEFPIVMDRDSQVARQLASLARREILRPSQFSLFQTSIQNAPYQVVARVFLDRRKEEQAVRIVGFTVNLTWIRTGYFPEFIAQIERVSGSAGRSAVSMAILDDRGTLVARNHPAEGNRHTRESPFALAFFDPSAASIGQLRNVSVPQWSTRVNNAGDPLLEAADSNANTTRALILIATVTSLVAIVLGVYFLHSHIELSAIKSDFVGMASHELKTPLAGIRLVADTLIKNRRVDNESLAQYGLVLSRETRRLTTLVDNLLTFSRINSSPQPYAVAAVDIRDAVSEALETFAPQIGEKAIRVETVIPNHVLSVNCDRQAIVLAFETIIDNAIKYSNETGSLGIGVRPEHDAVHVSFKDEGRGIMPDDAPLVFDKFFRGANAGHAGTGLGLPIARKIVEDHGGRISITSAPGRGTLVDIVLPYGQG